MKLKMYFSYTTRSLLRGGSRTILALFCVAVGVMAIVALQLVGLMANAALTSNVREINGGDIAVSPNTGGFTANDLNYFATLKAQGKITDFTAYNDTNATDFTKDSRSVPLGLRTVNTSASAVTGAVFPLVGDPAIDQPAGADFKQVLSAAPKTLDDGTRVAEKCPNTQAYNAAVTHTVYDELGGNVGDIARITTTTHQVICVVVAGVLANQGAYAGGNPLMIIPLAALPVDPAQPATYNVVNITTTTSAQAAAVKKDIVAQFPGATATTADEALQQAQDQVDTVRKFLQIVGLLALLIGGVGIINTMQVMLRRRRIEIAMLKTTGYRRRDLYTLFGLEAGLLGLVGGVLGAALAVGMSYLLKSVVENALDFPLPFVFDLATTLSGVGIGVATALIFGLLPIVRAAAIRPQNVIRELDEGRGVGSKALTVGLLVLLTFLFFLLAAAIMNSVIWSAGVVYGSLIVLGLLSLGFAVVVLVVSKLPVPERATPGFLLLVTLAVAAAVIMTIIAPGFGALLLLAAVLGYIVAFLPRTWKANVKMCFRNIGRQKTRTVTTLLALFVGVFGIGVILVLGQDISARLQQGISTTLPYNIITSLPASNSQEITSKLPLKGQEGQALVGTTAQFQPQCISVSGQDAGQPVQSFLKPGDDPDILGRLSNLEGYDVNQYPNGLPQTSLVKQGPGTPPVDLSSGRLLTPDDAQTTNILATRGLANSPFNLRVGSTITILNPLLAGTGAGGGLGKVDCAALQKSIQDGTAKGVTTFKIVGFFQTSGLFRVISSGLLGSQELTAKVGGPATSTVIFLKVNADQAGAAVKTLGTAAPDALIINIADFGAIINDILNKVIVMLLSVAGLALLAGVIIIANAVALAMLERRREMGILKSVGFTSRTVLGQVLLENGLIGGLGGLLAMACVTFALFILSKFVFKFTFGVGVPITLAMVFGTMLLAMITASLVAWRATRVRPLEVLRYE